MRPSSQFALALMMSIALAAAAIAQEPCASIGAGSAGCQSDGTQGGCHAQCDQCQIHNEMVPIKKWVYETKCVPVCELHPGGHCDCGPTCKFHFKKVLVKREVIVGHKCVQKCSVQ